MYVFVRYVLWLMMYCNEHCSENQIDQEYMNYNRHSLVCALFGSHFLFVVGKQLFFKDMWISTISGIINFWGD